MIDPSAPRKLTEDELERIINSIPRPFALTEAHAEVAKEQISEVLRAQLQDEEVSPDGIDELIERLINQFEASRVLPGTMVGLSATQSQANLITQASLSAVHKAGTAGMRGASGAVGRLRELFAKQPSKLPSENDACNIIFKDIQTQKTILRDRRSELVCVNLAGLLKNSAEGVPYEIEYQSTLFGTKGLPEWYYAFSSLYEVKLPELDSVHSTTKILRLHLDIIRLVEYRILLSEIRKALLATNSRILRFYISPLSIGIIDIWVLEEELHSYGHDITGDLEVDAFNHLYTMASWIDKIAIRGTPGIRDVVATEINIWKFMTNEQSYRHVRDNIYEYRLANIWQSLMDWDRPEMFWNFLNIKIVSKDENHGSWVVLDGVTRAPHHIINDASIADKKQATDEQTEALVAKKTIVTPESTPDKLRYWSTLWYARTIGTNLREIIMRDDVDSRFTISNKIFEVLDLYGITAARRVILEELYQAYGGKRDEPEFSVRHYSIMADFVSHTGVIRPSNNLAIQARSTLSKATYARQFSTLVSPSVFGIREDIGDVSSSIMIGTRAKIGPRAFEYQSSTTSGLTTSQIRAALQTGSKSSDEIDKLVSLLASTVDEPLYSTTPDIGEFGAPQNSGFVDDAEDVDAVLAHEAEGYEPAIGPPGMDDEHDEDEGGEQPRDPRERQDVQDIYSSQGANRGRQKRAAKDLIIDDTELGDIEDMIEESETIETRRGIARGTGYAFKSSGVGADSETPKPVEDEEYVPVSTALKNAVSRMGGTMSTRKSKTRIPRDFDEEPVQCPPQMPKNSKKKSTTVKPFHLSLVDDTDDN